MADLPHVISGNVKNEAGILIELAVLEIRNVSTSSGIIKQVTDSNGNYAYDLANLGYTEGDSITIEVSDRYNNETGSVTFAVSGDNTTQNFSLTPRTAVAVASGLRETQVATVGGNPSSTDNPIPVTLVNTADTIDLTNNPKHVWAITRSDGQPTTETVTIKGVEYVRTFTYDSNDFMTERTAWSVVTD